MNDAIIVTSAAVGIVATLSAGIYFLGGKLFATRADLHEVKGDIAATKLHLQQASTDITWLKGRKK